MIQIEVSSFCFMRQKVNLELKQKHPDIFLREEVSHDLLAYYRTILTSIFTEKRYKEFLREVLVHQILKSHNNVEFLELYDQAQLNYFNMIRESYYTKNYEKCLQQMSSFLENYSRNAEATKKQQI